MKNNKKDSLNKEQNNIKAEQEKVVKESGDDAMAKESNDFSFIQEKIKERPINKKKLIRKMISTAGAALLFGIIACASIYFLEPLFDRLVNGSSESDLTQVTLPEAEDGVIEDLPLTHIDPEAEEDVDVTVMVETPIEDMIVDASVSENVTAETENVQVQEYDISLDDYQLLYRQLYSLSQEVSKSVVTVTGFSEDSQWYSMTSFSEASAAGAIVGDNGVEYLILVDDTNLEEASSVTVTFSDNTSSDASFIAKDYETGLAIYGVPISNLSSETRSIIMPITIGSSVSVGLLGNAIIAVGYPLGEEMSVCYGAVTSNTGVCHVVDGQYQLITTDIYGSPYASGIIANARGQIVGFITQKYNNNGMENLISGYGMSGIRRLIENMSNGYTRNFVGLTLIDVTKEATEQLGVPQGAYVTKVEMNSPAMNVGITAGDVITQMGENVVHNVNDYMNNLNELEPDDIVVITYQRLSGDEYKSVSVEVRVLELI